MASLCSVATCVRRAFPRASIRFDRFHIMQLMNKAVDAVQRQEATETNMLKRTRYLWLRNPTRSTASKNLIAVAYLQAGKLNFPYPREIARSPTRRRSRD